MLKIILTITSVIELLSSFKVFLKGRVTLKGQAMNLVIKKLDILQKMIDNKWQSDQRSKATRAFSVIERISPKII